MSKKQLSQAEIDALIAGMLSGEVDQATLDAAMAGDEGASPAEDPVVAEAAPPPVQAIAEPGEPIDLGPITQAEVDAALREAGKGSLVSTALHTPSPAPGMAPAPPAPAPAAPVVAAPPAATVAPVAAAPAPVARLTLPAGLASSIMLDLELVLTAELVSTKMRLNQLLGLQPGAILELDRPADEPLDVIINGHPMMKAKVVTIGENYGIQVTETRLQQSA